MTQLTIGGAIEFLQARYDEAPLADRNALLVLLPVPGQLGLAALTNAKPDDPDGLLIEAGGRPTPIVQMIVHLNNIIGAGDANAAYSFPGVPVMEDGHVVSISSHKMTPESLLYIRGPGRTEQVERDVDGVTQMVGQFVADPIVAVETL